jgi:ligand-binding sensor domain-containing protein/nitrogen-specific signal transduction histidine kinase
VIAVRLTLLLLLFVSVCQAQPYYFRHYQVENGLSNNTVFASIQDKKGFMWFGTKDGLNRFDGYQFKVFHIKQNEDASLSRDQVNCLGLDSSGGLWVGTTKGLYRFDQSRENLVKYISGLNSIHTLHVDTKGRIWFVSDAKIYRYDHLKKKLTLFPHYFNTSSVCEIDGSMWFSSWDGRLLKLDEKTNRFTDYSVFNHSPKTASTWIIRIVAAENGIIYIGTTAQGIKKFDTRTGLYEDILTYNKDRTPIYVRDLHNINNKEIWFATESGIFIYNKLKNEYVQLKKNYLDPYSLSDNAIYTIHQDQEGGIWAGTYFGGVNYYPKETSSFQKYFPDYTEKSISGNAVRDIRADSLGNMWIGTEDAGLNRYDPETGNFKSFMPTGKPGSIANSNIHGLLVVGDKLWIGTFEHGLDILDIRSSRVIRNYSSYTDARGLGSNFVVSMTQGSNGTIYLGTTNGLFKYDKPKDYFNKPEGFPTLGFVSIVMEDHKGKIWIGTHESGVYKYDPQIKETIHYFNNPKDQNSLTTNTINALYEDSNKVIWIATEGGGLCKLSPDRKTISRYTTKNGLPSNFIFKVLEDNYGKLWVTTSKGLVSMDHTNGDTRIYTKANGLLNDQFNYNSGYKSGDGKLYFGSVKGMISFTPERKSVDPINPPVYITGFQVHNKEVPIGQNSYLKTSVINTNKIVLPYDQSSFSIDFAEVSFTSPEMTQYSYRMDGLEKEWTKIKSNRKVYFTNLKAGHYTFTVKAFRDGSNKAQERSLKITILPPFWATWWAYTIYGIVIISVLYYFARSYHQMQESKKKKEIYEAKIDFFTNIAHEIKTPLTLIKGPVENLSEMVPNLPEIKEEVKTMERNTERLVNLINQILDFRQTETKNFSLYFTPTNISEILQEAFVSFQQLAQKKKLVYKIRLPEEPIQSMADGEALYKIFSNLLSNAVKYGETKVEVNMYLSSENVKIEIENDGLIIPSEMKEKIFEPFFRLRESVKHKGTGIGLALARSLAELHRGNLYLSESKNGMNCFVLEIPYQPIEGFENETRKVNIKTSGDSMNAGLTGK